MESEAQMNTEMDSTETCICEPANFQQLEEFQTQQLGEVQINMESTNISQHPFNMMLSKSDDVQSSSKSSGDHRAILSDSDEENPIGKSRSVSRTSNTKNKNGSRTGRKTSRSRARSRKSSVANRRRSNSKRR